MRETRPEELLGRNNGHNFPIKTYKSKLQDLPNFNQSETHLYEKVRETARSKENYRRVPDY